jgi:hypothetical protein
VDGVHEIIAPYVLPLLFAVVITVGAFWQIFSKAGLPGWLAVGMPIPFIQLVLLFYLAYAKWPALPQSNAKDGTNPDRRTDLDLLSPDAKWLVLPPPSPKSETNLSDNRSDEDKGQML